MRFCLHTHFKLFVLVSLRAHNLPMPLCKLHLHHYTPLTSVQIKTIGIHEAQHPEVQFVMAVRAFPLYNNILSLWVFLGTLEPSGV